MSLVVWGEIACLAAACCWAVGIVYFRRPIEQLGAVPVNFGKNLISAVLLGATALALGQLSGLAAVRPGALVAIVVSGWVGLSLGDTALFLAVTRIGAQPTMLFQTLAPIFAAGLTFLLHGETMPWPQVAGAVVILSGVSLVVAPAPGSALTLSAAGIAWAVVAAFGQGAGVVLSKTAMSEIPIFAASFLRQAAAVFALLIMLAFNGQMAKAFGIFTAFGRFRSVLGPSVLSAYIGFSLMMVGVAWTPAAIAAVLLATTPIFGLFVDVALDGGRWTWRGVAGTVIAVGGVALLALG